MARLIGYPVPASIHSDVRHALATIADARRVLAATDHLVTPPLVWTAPPPPERAANDDQIAPAPNADGPPAP